MAGAVALQMMGDLNDAYEWIGRGRREDMIIRAKPRSRNAAAEGFVASMAADLAGLKRVGEFMLNVSGKHVPCPMLSSRTCCFTGSRE